MQLQDIVQSSLPAQSYVFQAQLGAKRVDCLLTLPNPPGAICIDAKFPLEAYRALREAKDEIAMAQARRDFTSAIRLHIKAIAEKYADAKAMMFLGRQFIQHPERLEEFVARIVRHRDRSTKPFLAILNPGHLETEVVPIRRALQEREIPVLPSFERAAAALARVTSYYERRQEAT